MFSIIPLRLSTEYRTSLKNLIIELCSFKNTHLLKVKEFFILNVFIHSYSVIFFLFIHLKIVHASASERPVILTCRFMFNKCQWVKPTINPKFYWFHNLIEQYIAVYCWNSNSLCSGSFIILTLFSSNTWGTSSGMSKPIFHCKPLNYWSVKTWPKHLIFYRN